MTQNKTLTDFHDIVDNLGRIYILLLFVSGAIWAFIAVNSVDQPEIFKIAMIYSLLLIFGFVGVMLDRNSVPKNKLGLDSRIWEGTRLKYQLAAGILVFFFWYLVFMRSGFAVATPQSIFAVNPAINYFLVTVLGPLAEDIFFFGVINITLLTLLRKFGQSTKNSLIIAALMAASTPLFKNVPNSMFTILGSAALIGITGFTKNPFLQKHGLILASALFIGGAVFPNFHSYAYQLNQQNFVAASWFGILMCLMVSYIGLLPVDITHIANNVAAIG